MTPFNETIREIAEKYWLESIAVGGMTTPAKFRAAILSAFDEFAKMEPSEEEMAVDAPCAQEDIRKGEPHNWRYRRALRRAMLAQAVKEMKE